MGKSKIKLIYDFDFTAECLIRLKESGRLARLSEREFRSYNGPRFIRKGDEITEYDGPVYLFMTNIIVDKDIYPKNTVIYQGGIDPREELRVPRQCERHYLTEYF